MTHVLDRMIEELEALVGALRRRDQFTLGGRTSNSERSLYESAEESLRILRAEREGPEPGQHIADTSCPSCGVSLTVEHGPDEGTIACLSCGEGRRTAADEALDETAEVLGCDTGHVADTARLMLDDYSRLGSRVAAMVDNARAEGRREAEEVFAETLERTRREAQRAGEVATDGIERAAWPIVEGVLQRIVHHIKEGTFWRMHEGSGDHWRGGEG